jgi:hypothetical protein
VNVDGLTLVGGDFELGARWFHFYGSCNNIKAINTLAYAATGTRYRGPQGVGNFFDFAKSNSSEFPLRTGSLSAGLDFQNSGFTSKHRLGISYDGNAYVVGASNIKPSSTTQGNLDDVAQSGLYLFTNTSGQFGARVAAAGANPVTTTALFTFDASGLNIPAGTGYYINAVKVVGARATGWTVATGTPQRGAFAAAAAGTASGAYVQAELQGALNRIAVLEARLLATQTDLTAHGLIGA